MRIALRLALATALLAVPVLATGCASRTVSDTVIKHYGLTIKLRSQKPWFGKTVARGYDHPAVIAAPRIELILGGIEIDVRRSDDSVIRERQQAIHPSLLGPIAEGLAEAFAEAGPDQEIVVLALRKKGQRFRIDEKHLTSFVTWMEGGQLYVDLSRIDWKWDPKSKTQQMPEPHRGDHVMPFRVVPNDVYAEAGAQTIRVDWRSTAFGLEPLPGLARDAEPGEAQGDAVESDGGATAVPAPAGEQAPGAAAAGEGSAAPAAGGGATPTRDPLGGLDADDYRALADLEEARAAGAISDADYERGRAEILQGSH